MREKIFSIIEPGHRGEKSITAYDILMLVAITASIIPLMFVEETKAFRIIEQITVTFFILDYILRWITVDYRLGKRMVFCPLSFHGVGNHRLTLHSSGTSIARKGIQDIPCYKIIENSSLV